ncbi:MAG: DUF177 domain-containing protein [Rhodocyclaceae bacterium]|jgi:uncharacterized protein|nr:Large ribosomal RNA subunit accumulation protein YceD [Rhodocyclaceae bacterium]MBZ0144362.1 YceD family protein [Rhodocyclaceae bacterium]MCC6878620.1 DUF177 domain-containing protein [Rhodocyclaceae bacterium]MCL4681219.1 DUF177 domain-containing protein [Rhodocyclaceae bacterium]
MSQRGLVIDSLEFARRHETLTGRLGLDVLPRLADSLFDATGSLDYEVTGETDGRNAFLRVKLEGVLSLTCQRCLGALAYDLSQRSRMMLVESGAPWPEDGQQGGLEDEACDAIEASRELDLVPLLEEEILLALPIAPRHERCKPPSAATVSGEASPFAQLAALKRK